VRSPDFLLLVEKLDGTGRRVRNLCMYGQEKSDSPIVPENPSNKYGDEKL
jgi:hypothetical protein